MCGSRALNDDSVAYLGELAMLETLDISWCRELRDPAPLSGCVQMHTLIASGTRLRSGLLSRLRDAADGNLQIVR